MNEEELQQRRVEHLKKKMSRNKDERFKATGLFPDEKFWYALYRSGKPEAENFPVKYPHVIPIINLIKKIEKDRNGFSYIADKYVLEYYNHPHFHTIKDRILDVLDKRNEGIEPKDESRSHIPKGHFHYWKRKWEEFSKNKP